MSVKRPLPSLTLRLRLLWLTSSQTGEHLLLREMLTMCHAHRDRGHGSASTASRNSPSRWRHILTSGCLCAWYGRQPHPVYPIHHALHLHLRIGVLLHRVVWHAHMHHGRRVMRRLSSARRILMLRVMLLRNVLWHSVWMMTRLALQCGIEAILCQVHIELVSRMLRHLVLLRRRGGLLRLLRWRMGTLWVGGQWTSGE
jgi:hypothetical protein